MDNSNNRLKSLLGLFLLGVLFTFCPTRPVIATEPTPTPLPTNSTDQASPPATEPCRLELGTECNFPTRDDLAGFALPAPRTYPADKAQGVPTYKLISVTFDREMDINTINNETFTVSQAGVPLAGSIRYIEISQMAVFYPDSPLNPNTAYSARVTTDVRDASGKPLAEEIVWSFTTSSGKALLNNDVGANGDPISGAGMNVYFGDLHSHSGYSDGQGTPADAFASARANGLDFFALTDHDILLTEAEWQAIQTQAQAATVNGAFVALRGFEFTHAQGHLNVFDSDTFVRGNDPAYANLPNFYTWLVDQPTAMVAQFNHPLLDETRNQNFNNFAFYPAADQEIVLRELTNATQFFLSLNMGWHVGTVLNSDTHSANWGCCPPMGAVAPNLTKTAILDSLRARRTFFVPPNDRNFALVMQANGYWMGSAIPKTTTVNFVVTAYNPDPTGKPLRMAIYDNGVRVANVTLTDHSVTQWTPAVTWKLGHYYYAEAYRDGWYYPAYSSPIWAERPPVSEAGHSQMVAPGMTVTLDGRGSWDPDGDALAYRWNQQSGASVSLTGANTDQPIFTTPGTFGDIDFELTVVDTGGLSSSDTTVVTVTDKPILAISKTAPATAEPGELITYTLTITNYGITEAVDVIVTDALPVGATYLSGGVLQPGNIVSWPAFNLAPNGGRQQVSFTVTALGGLANVDYEASCAGCIPAVGEEIVFTNVTKYYFPIIMK